MKTNTTALTALLYLIEIKIIRTPLNKDHNLEIVLQIIVGISIIGKVEQSYKK